jgi:hypothetical protein
MHDGAKQVQSKTSGTQARKPAAQARQSTADPATQFQRALGNSAVTKTASAPPWVQAKLAVSEPGDRHEREADRVADRVMRMPMPAQPPDDVSKRNPAIQRKCDSCGPEDERPVMRKAASPATNMRTATMAASPVPGGGRPLDAAARGFFEPRFGQDFSGVRIHNDPASASFARDINARAFTIGQHVGFASGEYAPETASGRRLLAHELTHTVQQRSGNMQISRTGRGAGRCAEGNSLSEERAGELAHQQIEMYYGLTHGFSTEVPIPRGTKDNMSGSCAGPDRPLGYVDLWKQTANNAFQIGEIKPITRSDPVGDAQSEAQHYQRRARHSVGRLSGTTPCGTMQSPGTDDNNFNTNYLNGTGSATGTSARAGFSLLSQGVTTATTGEEMGPYFTGDSSKVLKARRPADGAINYWCNPRTSASDDTFICNGSDGGTTSRVLDEAMRLGEQAIDDFISQQADALITQVINNLTIEEALTSTYSYIRPYLRDLVIEHWGAAAWTLIESMGDQQAVTYIASLIDQAVEQRSQQILRDFAMRIKREIIRIIRERLRRMLRAYLQAAMQALCQANFAVAVAMVIQQLTTELPQMFRRVFADIIAEAVLITVAAVVLTILLIIAIVVIVIVVVLAWPVVVGGGAVAGGGTVAVGGGSVAVGTGAVGTGVVGTGVVGTGVVGTGVVGTGVVGTGAVGAGAVGTGATLTLIQGGAAATGGTVAAGTGAAEITALAASVLLALGLGGSDTDMPRSDGGI